MHLAFAFESENTTSADIKTFFSFFVFTDFQWKKTRTRVDFSISVLVLEVFCGTRARKLSTRLHQCITLAKIIEVQLKIFQC